jgi:hypothetical protein
MPKTLALTVRTRQAPSPLSVDTLAFRMWLMQWDRARPSPVQIGPA